MRHRPTWLYYRIYVVGFDEVDDLLESHVRPAITSLRGRFPDLRWFFLRYVDSGGFHLRLRLATAAANIDSCEEYLDRRLTAALEEYDDAEPVRDLSVERRFVKRLYEPEYTKFGGPAGVAFAERLLQLGSEAVLSCVGARHRAARPLYGAAHTALMVQGLPSAQRVAFLHQYAWSWSGYAPSRTWQTSEGQLSPHNAAARHRARRLRDQIGLVLVDDRTRSALTGYAREFWDLLRSPERALVPRSDYLLVFHHVHLTNNRLGVVPAEEAQIARLLWLGATTAFEEA
ncbi:thiopeptide-type bacteriocin biosynthesis protein [Nocardia terpenica]|uniref:Thiopeptide-type bacteriocin biosynthesis domain-containing protein n=1 Tax=Nocardia terpenica TaxID=455432 RepID=A0A164LRT0_9NOCA|nr:thiopeptide-type bacteriocin biosynthesis protein [Nocardia terpenica]KZM72691.1 hypothetical protein AWN90_28330 [Nocardia terpenica]NQE92407.1 hypothetical protein [Nocardia terpenica]